MNADNPYFKSEIANIPTSTLKEMLENEITNLMFDFGQKVGSNDPEFDYLVNRTSEALRNYYPKWKLGYVDECFRNGKLDNYDKGQRITMKRLEYWFKCYNIATMDRVKDQWRDKEYSQNDNDRFVVNSCRYPNIIKFRTDRKPDYDGDDWTLEEIEKLPEYKKWLSLRTTRVIPNLTSKIGIKVY
ncbi:MAG TPA: hypothetical protein VFC36_00780 [Paludibacter sp.]|nr:hypothetical protein [Paludibacter sp.]